MARWLANVAVANPTYPSGPLIFAVHTVHPSIPVNQLGVEAELGWQGTLSGRCGRQDQLLPGRKD